MTPLPPNGRGIAVGTTVSDELAVSLGIELDSSVGSKMDVGTALGGTTGVFSDCPVGTDVGLAAVQADMTKKITITGIMDFLIDDTVFSLLNLN
jgi:hypothetical protein